MPHVSLSAPGTSSGLVWPAIHAQGSTDPQYAATLPACPGSIKLQALSLYGIIGLQSSARADVLPSGVRAPAVRLCLQSKAKYEHARDKGLFDSSDENFVDVFFTGSSKRANDSLNLVHDAHKDGAFSTQKMAEADLAGLATVRPNYLCRKKSHFESQSRESLGRGAAHFHSKSLKVFFAYCCVNLIK